MLPIALVSWRHERFLWEFQEEVSRNPGGDFASSIAVVADKFREQETKRVYSAFFTLFRELYEGDIPSLKKDLLKIQLLCTVKVKATPSQRIELLRCLYGVMLPDDLAGIMARCEEAEVAYRIVNGCPALDALG